MSTRTRIASIAATLGTLVPSGVVMAQSFTQRIQQGVNAAGTTAGFNAGSPPLPVIIGNIIAVLLSLTGAILVLIMLYAGFTWMTAGGDTDKVKTARQWIYNSVIGLIIVSASFAIANFVITQISGGATGSGPAPTTQ